VDALGAIYTLHAGEREALNLCLDLSGALLLTDDTAARLAAKTLAIEAHGTLGLLLRAIRRRQLSKERVLDLLHQIPGRSTLHIRPGLLTEIIQQVAATSEP
jgi:predicted nucleic acid-binding protein